MLVPPCKQDMRTHADLPVRDPSLNPIGLHQLREAGAGWRGVGLGGGLGALWIGSKPISGPGWGRGGVSGTHLDDLDCILILPQSNLSLLICARSFLTQI